MRNGLDLQTWLTITGVLVMFFVLPGVVIEYDRRKQLRESDRLERIARVADQPK